MKISVFKNGLCHRREREELMIIQWAYLNGWAIDDNYATSDLIFFISCAFNKPHYDAALAEIKNLEPFKEKTIVLGCLPDIDEDMIPHEMFFSKLSEFDMNMAHLDEKLGTTIPFAKVLDVDCDSNVKILSGCLNNCNYCNINKATKRLISEPLPMIVRKVKVQWAKGITPLLMGEDAGAWGKDIGKTLGDLMIALLHEVIIHEQIDLDNLDAHWVDEYYENMRIWIGMGFIRRMAIGVQSFSQPLVKAMGRKQFDVEKVVQFITDVKDIQTTALNMPYAGIDMHLMVGHPAETEKDFKTTCAIVEQLQVPFTVFKCWIRDKPMHPEADRREKMLYALADNLEIWACPVCKMKRHECICDSNNKAPDQPRGTLGIHQPHSSTGDNIPHDLD